MKVYLEAAIDADLAEELPAKVKSIPLWRRMTPLQKAVMLGLVKLDEKFPELLQACKTSEAPIYMSSAYGEISPMLRVTESIAEQSLPVSPKDFQHSVLNAAIAYFCMQIATHQAGFAISGSFESPDMALQLAARRIDSGFDHGAIVIHAEELMSASAESARAEILVLGGEKSARSIAKLSRFDQSHHDFLQGQEPKAHDFDEGSERRIAWLLDDGQIQEKRRLRNRDGDMFSSEWEIY
ncbi:MAG: hypothetical protein EOP07_08320 [Proteobacteria bacterium]|nr:MAG: hypothetical protein EOP07_08320 [Pseudomonadota bacterium]